MFTRSLTLTAARLARPTVSALMSTAALLSSFRVASTLALKPTIALSPLRLYSTETPKGKHDWADKGPIEFQEVKELTQNPGGVLLLDVRERDEIQQGNIPTSLPLPLSELKEALGLEPDEFQAKYTYQKPKADQPIVVYCRSGRRSESALEMLRDAGTKEHRFTNVRNYTGSWLDWTAKYKPSKNEVEDDEEGW